MDSDQMTLELTQDAPRRSMERLVVPGCCRRYVFGVLACLLVDGEIQASEFSDDLQGVRLGNPLSPNDFGFLGDGHDETLERVGVDWREALVGKEESDSFLVGSLPVFEGSRHDEFPTLLAHSGALVQDRGNQVSNDHETTSGDGPDDGQDFTDHKALMCLLGFVAGMIIFAPIGTALGEWISLKYF